MVGSSEKNPVLKQLTLSEALELPSSAVTYMMLLRFWTPSKVGVLFLRAKHEKDSIRARQRRCREETDEPFLFTLLDCLNLPCLACWTDEFDACCMSRRLMVP